MYSIILHGALGRMGRMITEEIRQKADYQLLFGVDPSAPASAAPLPCPLFDSIETGMKQPEIRASVDAAKEKVFVVDFSHASAMDSLLDQCRRFSLPLVSGTTGLSPETEVNMKALSQQVPVLHSANMSIGVALLRALCQSAAAFLHPLGYDIEIEERHHNQKVDAPSGTALMLADSMSAAIRQRSESPEETGLKEDMPEADGSEASSLDKTGTADVGSLQVVTDRSRERRPRQPQEIGIASLRGGTIVGEHRVLFAGQGEQIELCHTAESRRLFASGALHGVEFLSNQKPGLYSMQDLVAFALPS